jgi:hypothetical protein
MRNRVNDISALETALQPSEITFRSQAAWWLSEIRCGRLKCRQKNKRGRQIRTTTLDAYTTAVGCLNEQIGDRTLRAISAISTVALSSKPPVACPCHHATLRGTACTPFLKGMGRRSAGFHIFRRFRESILQMSEARTLLIDYWMGHANGEMSVRYGKQLLANVQWRQKWPAKVGLGFTLSANKEGPLVDKSGQVLVTEETDAVSI